MPNVLIRNLPDDVHAALQRRAADAGNVAPALPLVGAFAMLASQPDDGRGPGSDQYSIRRARRFRTAVDDLRDDREARDRR